jgi:two-component system sensor histidine kinase SenX3
MLRDYRGSPTAREPLIHLDQIQRGAREMSALIDGLLALSRISHMEMRRELTSLDELVKRAVNQVRQDSGDRVIEWRLASLPSVACDPDLMLQVFANLIDNAVKYSNGARDIEVGLRREGRDGEWAVVWVRDHGVGIPRDEQRKIFERFHRVSTGLVHDVKGSGLGLAIVRHVVAAHGGTIELASRPGEGSTFSIRLPLEAGAAPARAAARDAHLSEA